MKHLEILENFVLYGIVVSKNFNKSAAIVTLEMKGEEKSSFHLDFWWSK